MGEHARTTEAPPEAGLYPRGPGETLRERILDLDEALEAATAEYASRNEAAARMDRLIHAERYWCEEIETAATARLLPTIAGKNEAERRANLAAALQSDPAVAQLRDRRERATMQHSMAAELFRVADQRQKALRAQLDALSALVRMA